MFGLLDKVGHVEIDGGPHTAAVEHVREIAVLAACPKTRMKPPIRSPRGGLALIISAPILGFALFLLSLSIVSSVQWLIIIGALLFGASKWLIDIGRQMKTLDGMDLLKRDPRPPVIYLRPFSEDERMTRDGPVGERIGGAGVTSGHRVSPASREREISRTMTEIGPFVALGKPGDRLAPLGAARLYVSDVEWQPTVEAFLRRANAVVLQPEMTHGAWWELVAVANIVDLRRVLILVPNPSVRPLGYVRVQRLTVNVLPVPLPVDCSAADAFMFDRDGRPQPMIFGRRSRIALEPFVAQVRQLSMPLGARR